MIILLRNLSTRKGRCNGTRCRAIDAASRLASAQRLDAEEDEERHPLMSSLDVNALPNSNVPSPQVLMDNPREVIGVSNNRSNLHRKEPVYTITSVSASGTQVVPPKDPPPSEISV